MSDALSQYAGRTVIVGSGIAGLMAALTLAPQPVLLLTRGALGCETSSAWAQGGIAASLGADDSTALHLADTLAAGDGLCDAAMAADIVSTAPPSSMPWNEPEFVSIAMHKAGSFSGWKPPMAAGASCMPKVMAQARPL